MILDQEAILSDGQAFTTVATHPSTNVYDSGSARANMGDGEEIRLRVKTRAGVTSGGAATVTVALQDSADNSSFATVFSTPAFAIADMPANRTLLDLALPRGLRRYVRVAYIVGGVALTGGSFDAFLAKDTDAWSAKPKAYTVG